MRTTIAKTIGAAAIVLSLAAAGSGAAHADAVLSASGGGQTCYDYVDSHGHIYTVCNAPLDPSFERAFGVDDSNSDAGETRLLVRFYAPIW